MSGRIPWAAPVDMVPATIAGGRASEGEIFGAAAEQMRLVDNSNAAMVALEEAYRRRTDAIKAATGEDLGNPMTDPTSRGLDFEQRGAAVKAGQERYQARLEALAAAADPETRDIIGADRPVHQDAEAAARTADETLGRLMASNSSWPAMAASLAGQFASAARDPAVLGSMFIGGGSGGARTVIGRILQSAAREAFVNGATTAVLQPGTQAWREQAGLPHGFDQAASNVLFGAALGGGLGFLGKGIHEAAVPLLRRIAPALTGEARGALDALDLTNATDSLRPEGVTPQTFDRQVMKADIAAQGVEVPLSPDAPDDAQVNRIVNSLAPAPESIAGGVEPPRSDARLDELIQNVLEPGRAALRAPTPILDHLRALGGVDPKSNLADELRGAGVTARSVYRKGGLTSIDNLPHSELPEAVRHAIAEDGNGYASQDALIQAAGGEAQGGGHGFTVDDMAGLRDHYERQGVDFTLPREEVRAAIRAVDAADAHYNGATDEVTHVPPGLTRRRHTDALVRGVLELQPGLPAERVRDAVNLALFEGVPIDEAVDHVLAGAAGVPRASQPVAPHAVAARGDIAGQIAAAAPGTAERSASTIDGTAAGSDGAGDVLDLEAERAALEELGFAGDIKLPIGDDLMSLDELQRHLEQSSHLESVVNACKA